MSPPPPREREKQERQQKIELALDAKRPGVGERCAASQPKILRERQEFPERRHDRILAQRRQKKADRHDHEKSRQNAESPAPVKEAHVRRFSVGQRRKQLTRDEVTAEDKEEINAD